MPRNFVLFVLVPAVFILACCGNTPSPEAKRLAELRRQSAAEPENGQLIYLLSIHADRAGDARDAVRQLERLEALKWDHGVDLTQYSKVTADAAFRAAAARLNSAVPRISHSATFFTIPQRELGTEGIAWDPVDDVYYLSSIRERKVIAVSGITADGHASVRDFVPTAQHGLLGVLGLKVDRDRRLLWAASEADPDMHGLEAANRSHSVVAAFDLRSGALVRKIEWGDATHPALANDLALLDDGTVYVTDSEGGGVMRIQPGRDTAEPLLPGSTFRYPNGIAIAPDQRHLFVADADAVTVVDLHDLSRRPLALPSKRHTLAGIDGMSFDRGALVAIQNDSGLPRLLRVTLDASLAHATAIEVLESGNPLFDIPTTGTIAGRYWVYMANSAVAETSVTGGARRDLVVLRLPLA